MVSTLAVLFLNPNDFETVRGDFVVSFSFFFLFQIQRASDRKNLLLLLLLLLILLLFFSFVSLLRTSVLVERLNY